jgi:hypothetical protein
MFNLLKYLNSLTTMEPVFFNVKQGQEHLVFDPTYFFMESAEEMELVMEDGYESQDTVMEDGYESQDTESKSIDYGDSETEDTLEHGSEYDEEVYEFVHQGAYHSFLESISVPHPELEQAQELSRLEESLTKCMLSISHEVSIEEDYITNKKFEHGEIAIVIVSKVGEKTVTYAQNPLQVSTVKQLLKSGNCRNPCDNNPTDSYVSVKIKLH